MPRILDGVAIAAAIKQEVAEEVRALAAQGVRPGLAAVLVGNVPASEIYVRSKVQTCADLGLYSELITPAATVSTEEMLALVAGLNARDEIDGILIQLPLPAQVDTKALLDAVAPTKDVDGFHPINVGKLMLGDASGFRPCTPAGIVELLARSEVRTDGAEVIVLGRGNIVGKPMAAMLCQKGKNANATVTICHSATRDIKSHCLRADILIAAMGVPEFVKADMVKPSAVVIDVGVNRVDGKIVGDVDFAEVQKIAGKITPNPGGVGPMTIAMLMQNTVRAAENSGN